jgi:formylglycine-generating enzyme required for sulfatase activity
VSRVAEVHSAIVRVVVPAFSLAVVASLSGLGAALARETRVLQRGAQTRPQVADAGVTAEAGPVGSSSDAGGLSAPRLSVDGMLPVPGGAFTMGSDREGEGDERPAHPVTVRGFLLDETEVTNEAYQRCVDARVCVAPDPDSAEENHVGPDRRFRRPRQPVSAIDWANARAYCQWVGKRLPTEAEFERAVRGEDGRRYPWGNERPTRERAVFGSSVTQDVGTHPLGRGPYGHHDLTGNVWEWIADAYDPWAYRRPGAPQGRPGTCREILVTQNTLRARRLQGFTGSNPIPTECERVLRGGAFNFDPYGMRSTNRVHHPGRFRLVMSGFRCARDAP